MPIPDGGGGSDVYIDADAMAVDADSLGQAARSVTDARDSINASWRTAGAAFGSSPAGTAFGDCCQVWVTGTNVAGQLTQYAAQYTQDVANAYGAADQTLAATATGMYDPSTMPKPGVHYKQPKPNPYVA